MGMAYRLPVPLRNNNHPEYDKVRRQIASEVLAEMAERILMAQAMRERVVQYQLAEKRRK